MTRTKLKNRKRKSIIPIVIIFLIMFLFVGVVYATNIIWNTLLATKVTEYISRSEPFDINERMNLVLLAIDAPTLQEPARADSIKIVSLDPKEHTMNMMTIPRDSYVAPAGFRPDDRIKINAINNPAVNSKFGTDMLLETIEELLGIKIHGFVKINFNGFIDVIDSIGGIDFYIENEMHYKDSVDGYLIDLPSGFHHLNGSMALQYVRFRSDKYADWAAWEGEVKGRSARQTKFVKAIIKEMTKPSNWGKIPTAVGVVMENIQTDIPMEEIYTFAEILRHVDTESIKDVAFSGKPGYVPSFYYKNGQKVDFNMSVIIPNLNELKNLGQEYFSDEQ